MTESILSSIKKLMGGIPDEYEGFDTDLIIHINSVFQILNQLGVGVKGYKIINKENTWDEFIGDTSRFESVKTYVYLKVRLVFDPPTSSMAMDAMKNVISELEWRLNGEAESNDD